MSHVRRNPRTLDYVIFLFDEGALCLIHVIGHGDTIEALERASARRRKEHSEGIIQIRSVGGPSVESEGAKCAAGVFTCDQIPRKCALDT